MADPASIVGTVVGVASLGIQSCQIIQKYYSQHKSYGDDIKQVLDQLQGLEGMLSALRDAKSRIEVDNHEPSSQLNMALGRCETSIKRLDDFAQKCGIPKDHNDGRSRIGLAKDKILWPFRKEALNELRANVDSLQQSLALIFNITGMDVIVRNIASLSLKSDTVTEYTTQIGQQLVSLTAEMALVKQYIQKLPFAEQEYVSIGAQRLQVECRNNGSASTITPTEQFISTNDSVLCDDINQSESSMVLLSSNMETEKTSPYSQVDTCFTLNRQKRRRQNATKNWGCQCRYIKSHAVSGRGRIMIIREEEYTHQPDCPRSRHADYSRTVAARLTVCNQILRFCAMVGWEESRKAGWYGLRPVLKFRNIVPFDAPAFKLLHDVEHQLGTEKYPGGDIKSLLDTAIRDLRLLLSGGTSPVDTTESGHSLGDTALFVIARATARTSDTEILFMFLDACFNEGLFNVCRGGDECSKFIATWQNNMILYGNFGKPNVEILQYLVRKLDSYWAPHRCYSDSQFVTIRGDRIMYDLTSQLLKSEAMKNVSYTESVLQESILERSEENFCVALQSSDIKWLESVLLTPSYSNALASWAHGLEKLMSSIPFCRQTEFTSAIWCTACFLQNLDALEVILPHLGVPQPDHWFILHYNPCPWLDSSSDLRWPRILSLLAEGLHEAATKQSTKLMERDDYFTLAAGSALYCSRSLSVQAAELLWQAGFQDINSVAPCDISKVISPFSSITTPLWSCFYHDYPNWPTIFWLIAKGANLSWLHPRYRTTPAHVIGRSGFTLSRLGYTYPSETWDQEQHWDSLQEILLNPVRDKCLCSCSPGGCLVIGCAASRYTYFDRLKAHPRIALSSIVDKNRQLHRLPSAILRVLTFEQLSLTHTCCYRIGEEYCNYHVRPTKEEIQEIHDIEHTEIALLERLVQEFEVMWAQYPGTFAKFIRKIWKPRMRRERKKREMDANFLREAGITLEQVPQELAKDTAALWEIYGEGYISDSEDDETDTSDEENEDEQEEEVDDGYVTAAEEDE
ncbi:hypothetical protein J1614_009893 [Plenodomus biglobosus]|nr:hypothetical protein J1614_009893 [Plenodomus biglobosus]